MNSVSLIGRFYGKSSQGKTTSGNKWVRFTVGWYNPYKKKVEYFRCVAFAKRAEICLRFMGPKVPVGISGRLEPNTYERDGVKHSDVNIIVHNFDFPCATPKDRESVEAEQRDAPAGVESFGGEF